MKCLLMWASRSMYVHTSPLHVARSQATAALVTVLKGDHDFMQHFSNIQVKLTERRCKLSTFHTHLEK